MNSRTKAFLLCAFLFTSARVASALDFNVDISSYNYSNSIINYGVSVHLSADFNDFDELVDGYSVTSPDGTFVLVVSTESFNASQGFLFPTLPVATAAVYGDWTFESLVLGFPLESQTFRVSSAGLSVADYPPAQITMPSFQAGGVSPQPIITFSGPPGATDIGIGLSPAAGEYPNEGFAFLPPSAGQYTPTFTLNPGLNEVYVIFYLPNGNPDKVLIESPSGIGWNAVLTRACLAFSEFSVGGGGELRLTGPERGGEGFRWSFPTESGRTYDVEFKEDLNASDWQVLQTITGDGSAKTFTVSANQNARFFRIARR